MAGEVTAVRATPKSAPKIPGYAPSKTVYWQHGHSTETDFIYVTTQTLSREQIEHLNDEVGPKRSLLIACIAFRVKHLADFPNLTLRKIPKAVLRLCEWGMTITAWRARIYRKHWNDRPKKSSRTTVLARTGRVDERNWRIGKAPN